MTPALAVMTLNYLVIEPAEAELVSFITLDVLKHYTNERAASSIFGRLIPT